MGREPLIAYIGQFNGTEHFVQDGKEVEYSDLLLSYLVECMYDKDGEFYFVLGKQVDFASMNITYY